MVRTVHASIALGIVALGGFLMPLVDAVTAQDVGTPVASPVAVNPCDTAVEGTPAATPRPVATPTGEIPFDLLYLDLAIPHGERLQAVVGVVANRAEHAELRRLAVEMRSDIEQRLRRLQVWRSIWHGEVPSLTDAELVAGLDRVGADRPGRGGVPGAFEILGMDGLVTEICARLPEDPALLDAMIEAVDADLLLSQAAVELATREELQLEAGQIAERDQRWLEAFVALRDRWYAATPEPGESIEASSIATPSGVQGPSLSGGQMV